MTGEYLSYIDTVTEHVKIIIKIWKLLRPWPNEVLTHILLLTPFYCELNSPIEYTGNKAQTNNS